MAAVAVPVSGDWSNLPDLPLLCILRRLLPSYTSILSFAAVCRQWHLLFHSAAASLLQSLPPFLLRRRRRLHLRPSISFPSPLSSHDRDLHLLPVSHGRLIFLRRRAHPLPPVISLADPFTGETQTLPPGADRAPYYYAALVGRRSVLLFFFSRYSFLSYSFASSSWHTHPIPRRLAAFVTRVAVYGAGRIFALDDSARLLELRCHSESCISVELLAAAAPAPEFDRWRFGPQLLPIGRATLMLVLVLVQLENKSQLLMEGNRVVGYKAYRWDMPSMRWDAVADIGDRCLFIDAAGKQAALCEVRRNEPLWCKLRSLWTAQANQVYVPAYGSEVYAENFALDGVIVGSTGDFLLFEKNL